MTTDLEGPLIPNENIWALKAFRPFNRVYAVQGFDDVEQSVPECHNFFAERGRWGFLEEVLQRAMIGILQKDIVGITMFVTSQKLYQVFPDFIGRGELLKRIDFILVITVGVLGVVRLEDIGIRWSSTVGLVLS